MKKKLLTVFFLGIFICNLGYAAGAKKNVSCNGKKSKSATSKLCKTKKKTQSKKHRKTVAKSYMYGAASYYGGSDGFEGQKMANGDIFDSNNINICAHPTLALGTKLKVTNLNNGRSIYVEVTDRMPKGNRVIDLSKGGARALGMHGHGVGKVLLTRVSESTFRENQDNLEVEEYDNGAPH